MMILFNVFIFLVFFQKHEKPKYVLCIAFAENGDAITGDSSGNIYIWAKGQQIIMPLFALPK